MNEFVCIAAVFAVVIASPVIVNVEEPRYLLPSFAEPSHYDLSLKILNFKTFSGNVEIKLVILEPTNFIALNMKDLSFLEKDVKLTSLGGDNYDVTELQYHVLGQQADFFFETTIKKGVYKLSIDFHGIVRNDLKGLYKSSYKNGAVTRELLTTHFEATYARMVFPCFDEPRFKATFIVSAEHGSEHHALSNMPVIEKITGASGTIKTIFQITPKMSTYLLALVVSDYETLATENDKFRVYSPPHNVNETEYSTKFLKKSLTSLEDLLGHSYQLPKLDMVAIPDFNMGAMENWGLLTFRSIYLLYNEEITPARTHQSGANLISHELAHMWFGNEVTPEWWSYTWLSEGFARYFEYYVTSSIETDWKLWDQFGATQVQSAMAQDDKNNNRPMSYYTVIPGELNGLFDYVVYAKSASVIRMFQNVFGMENFIRGLNDYIRKRSYKTANPDHLYSSFDKFLDSVELPGTTKELFESWTENPGYPVVNVEIDYSSLKIKIHQKRFWMPLAGEKAPENKLYFVPINFATNSDLSFEKTEPILWLTPEVPEIEYNFAQWDKWVLVNKQQTGYYRVNYNPQNWIDLIEHLKSSKMGEIHFANRGQLVDDAANLAKSGLLYYSIALDLFTYLDKEKDYAVWVSAYNALNHLIRMLRGSKHYTRFEHLLQTITMNMFDEIGLEGPNDHISRLHRGNTIYLACYSGVQACKNATQKYIQKMIEDPSYNVPDESQASVFCTAFKYQVEITGNIAEALFKRLVLEKENSMDRYVTGMGCSRNMIFIDETLKMTLKPIPLPGVGLSPKERNNIFISIISGSQNGLIAGLKFMVINYGSMNQRFASMAEIFKVIGPRINNEEVYALLFNIITLHNSKFDAATEKEAWEAQKIGVQNVAWIAEHLEVIEQWLIDEDYEISTPKPGGNLGFSFKINSLLLTFGIFTVILY